MKELTIEQKAKAYDKAIERAKALYDNDQPISGSNVIINNIFPELKESEDERIRKELINYLITDEDNGVPKVGQIPIDNVITWLEKQKTIDVLDKEEREFADNVDSYRKDMDEFYKKGYNAGREAEKQYWLEKQDGQKPQGKSALEAIKEEKVDNANKVEPKFKADDWVVSPNGVYWHIDRIENNRYEVTSDTGKCADWPLDTDLYHLWTIQDAKDGDVLCYKDEISLYKHDIKNCTKQGTTFGGFVYHCCYDGKRFIVDSFYSLTEQDKMDIHPATKEQRDTLEKAMADAGWEFDFEKKELKKISQRMISAEAKEAMYGNPTAWSEEDENILEAITYTVKNSGYSHCIGVSIKVMIDWLKSLKQRINND